MLSIFWQHRLCQYFNYFEAKAIDWRGRVISCPDVSRNQAVSVFVTAIEKGVGRQIFSIRRLGRRLLR
jgi:hypothetical protein